MVMWKGKYPYLVWRLAEKLVAESTREVRHLVPVEALHGRKGLGTGHSARCFPKRGLRFSPSSAKSWRDLKMISWLHIWAITSLRFIALLMKRSRDRVWLREWHVILENQNHFRRSGQAAEASSPLRSPSPQKLTSHVMIRPESYIDSFRFI